MIDDADPALLALARRVVGRAAAGEQLEVAAARTRRTSIRVYDGEIEALTVAETSAVGIRVVLDGGRQGMASAGSLDDDIVDEALAEARDNATFAAPDPDLHLAVPDGVAVTGVDRWSDAVAEVGLDHKIDLARTLEAMVRSADPRITGVRSASYGDSRGASVLVSSTGIEVGGQYSSASVGVQALSAENGQTQTGYGSSFGLAPDEIDLAEAADDAVHRATRLLGAVQPASTRLTLVLEPRLAATVLGIVAGMLSGERLLKGRTPFADRVGDQIADPRLHLVDDPTDAESYGASSTDGEGLACRRNELVVDGVLAGFLHNSYTGGRCGVGSNGAAIRSVGSSPGVGARALAVRPGDGDLDQLVAATDHGLLVNSMAGLHSGVNAVSGDFSVGVDGLMIRNGTLAEPIREATIASAIQRLLLDLGAVGADIERLPGGSSVPTLVIHGVALSGR